MGKFCLENYVLIELCFDGDCPLEGTWLSINKCIIYGVLVLSILLLC
jgi:hypothetical protein